MRFVDVSVAAIIGMTALASLVAWNPYSFEEGSRLYLREASLQDYMTTIVAAEGVPWFQHASFSSICNRLSQYSNSTVEVSAVVDGLACSTPPPRGAPSANLTIDVGSARVLLQAWQVAGP
ncbi:MAG: hypothetical protein LYZ69_03010 [Nitrososphaerales archaeon]|nr:hypothetical protein [Nitrososphaerales archaeon]